MSRRAEVKQDPLQIKRQKPVSSVSYLTFRVEFKLRSSYFGQNSPAFLNVSPHHFLTMSPEPPHISHLNLITYQVVR